MSLTIDQKQDIERCIVAFEDAYMQSSRSLFGDAHFHIEDLKTATIYIRMRTGKQEQWTRPVLILSRIDVPQKGSGFFTELLARTKKLCIDRGWLLEVECVLESRFVEFLQRNDFFNIDGQEHGCWHWHNDDVRYNEQRYNR